MCYSDLPILSDHVRTEMRNRRVSLKQLAETLVYGVGILTDSKESPNPNRRVIIGPDVTLVISARNHTIITTYPNKHRHRFYGLKAAINRKLANEQHRQTQVSGA